MLLKRGTVNEIIRFGIVGALATGIHYGVYWLLNGIINLNLAYTVGYFVSFVVNYILSAQFTFRKRKSVKNGFGICGAHLFNYLLQMGLLNLFIWLGFSKSLAPVPVYCVTIPTNFIIVRFVFRRAG